MKRWRFALLAAALALIGASAAPPLAPVLSASDWIGARPSSASLSGHVVVVDVFTVDCYNCRNVVPTLRGLYAADHVHGLDVIGIHAPETPSERDRSYVTASLKQQGIVWPVAIDNAFALWHTYGVNAWPTQLFFDRSGRLRATIVGDSQDDDVKRTVESLLSEK